MTEFVIEYNPYLVRSVFKCNGKTLGEDTAIGARSGQRLQILLGPSTGWRGLIYEIADFCADSEVNILFKGRKIDYEDLEYASFRYEGGVFFTTELDEGKSDAAVMSELDGIIDEIRESGIPGLDADDERGKSIFDAYEDAKSGFFDVSVIATMSSGKSTLINSLLHTELLPSENKACTATVAYILDNDGIDGFEAECRGADNETVVHPRAPIDAELLRQYNADEAVHHIYIEGNIPSIKNSKIRLRLLDTPGPNNSRDENHGRLTGSIIKKTNSIILYVMNATQIGINDDHQLLWDISNEMSRAGKQSRDRFIFVVNKCDALDEERGETLDRLLSYVTEYLAGFGIKDPVLIPTSARLALLIRKDRMGDKLTRKERMELESVEDFIKSPLLHFEKYATLTPGVREEMEYRLGKYRSSEETADLEALVHTGLPVVEATVNEYIDKYAYPIKINDAVRDILNLLAEMNMRGKFEESIASDSGLLKKVRGQITRAKKRQKESTALYEDFKARIASLDLVSIDRTREQLKIESELQALSRPYNGRTKVDLYAARQLVNEFQNSLTSFQSECEGRLRRAIDEQIFNRCNELLSEYTRVVSSILDDIKIEGFDFKRVSSIGSIRVSGIDTLIRNNQTERFRTETRTKDNPARAGFWGFFKFWQPKTITYQVQVKDGDDVNVKNVIVDILSDFSRSMKKGVADMFSQADSQVKMYKDAFNGNIDRLSARISEIIGQLERDVEKSEDIAARVAKDKKALSRLADIEQRINALLSV